MGVELVVYLHVSWEPSERPVPRRVWLVMCVCVFFRRTPRQAGASVCLDWACTHRSVICARCLSITALWKGFRLFMTTTPAGREDLRSSTWRTMMMQSRWAATTPTTPLTFSSTASCCPCSVQNELNLIKGNLSVMIERQAFYCQDILVSIVTNHSFLSVLSLWSSSSNTKSGTRVKYDEIAPAFLKNIGSVVSFAFNRIQCFSLFSSCVLRSDVNVTLSVLFGCLQLLMWLFLWCSLLVFLLA